MEVLMIEPKCPKCEKTDFKVTPVNKDLRGKFLTKEEFPR
jgi:hypothetical protein